MFGTQENLITIQDGVVTMFGHTDDEPYAFQDGQLFLHPAYFVDDSMDQHVILYADGMISTEFLGTLFYCEKIGGAAPEPQPEPMPEPQPEPLPEPASDERLEKKFVCTAVTTGGYAMSVDSLGGEYSVIFHADGTATLVLVGAELPEITWSRDGSAFVIDYYGAAELRFVPQGDGFTLDYFGSMQLTFEAV